MNTNNSTINTPSSWPKAIVDTLEEYECDIEPLLGELAIDRRILNDTEAFIPQDSVTRLWNHAAAISGDDGFGIRAGFKVHAHTYPSVGYSLMSCDDLKSSCERLLRYQRILAQGFLFDFEIVDHNYRLSFAIQADQLPGSIYAIDSAMSSFLNFVDWLTHGRVKPIRATLCRRAPKNSSAFDAIFQCPIGYEAKHNTLLFSPDAMALPLPTAHKSLSALHDENANKILQQLKTSSFSEQLKQRLIDSLPSGEPRQEQIARDLNISTSTLKRRLQSERTTFKQLLDDCRQQLALDYLSNVDMSLTEITYLLGFSENSAFSRAFKRWFGTTPLQWRQSEVKQ